MAFFFWAIKSKHRDLSRAMSLLQSSSDDKTDRPASAEKLWISQVGCIITWTSGFIWGLFIRLLVPAGCLKVSGSCRIKVSLSISSLSSKPLFSVTVNMLESFLDQSRSSGTGSEDSSFGTPGKEMGTGTGTGKRTRKGQDHLRDLLPVLGLESPI